MKMSNKRSDTLAYTINNTKDCYSEKGQNNMKEKEVRRLMSEDRKKENVKIETQGKSDLKALK